MALPTRQTRLTPAPAPGGETATTSGNWLMLAVLLLGQFMCIIDVLVVNVAMPSIAASLHASGASLQLVVGGYTIAYAMLLITGARLGDRYGRRRAYLAGVGIFTAASLACALAPDSQALIGFRLIQGADAAVPRLIPPDETGSAETGSAETGSAETSSAETSSAETSSAETGPGRTAKLDLAGLAAAACAVLLVVLPLVLGHEEGWPAWCFGCIAAGALLAAGFALVERRVAARGGDPLLNLAVLRAPALPSGLVTLAATQIAYGDVRHGLLAGRPVRRRPAGRGGHAPRRRGQPPFTSIESMSNWGNPMNCCMTFTTRSSRILSTLPTGPCVIAG